MNKYKINNLGVFKHPMLNQYFIGFFNNEEMKTVQALNGITYEGDYADNENEHAKFIRPLAYYYPEPAYKKSYDYEEINCKKVPKLPAKLVAEDNAFITEIDAQNFEKKELSRIVKKEIKMIDSGKLISSHCFVPILKAQEAEMEF
jgi:hypothetical protein